MTFAEKFPQLDGYLWGNSQIDLGDDEIAFTSRDGWAYTAQRAHSISLSWRARQEDGFVRVEVQDNSCGEEDFWCETGSALPEALPA